MPALTVKRRAPSWRPVGSTATAVSEDLCGSIPIVITAGELQCSAAGDRRGGHPDLKYASSHASVEPHHGGRRPAGTLSVSQPEGGKEPANLCRSAPWTLRVATPAPARFNKSGACARGPITVLSARPPGRVALLPGQERRHGLHDIPKPPATDLIVVTGGVDTHKDTHTAAASTRRRLLGHREFAATTAGYAACWPGWARLGSWSGSGLKVAGSMGLAWPVLQSAGVELVEVDRPDRKPAVGRVSPTRRRRGRARAARLAGPRCPEDPRREGRRAARVAGGPRSAVRPAPMRSARSRR